MILGGLPDAAACAKFANSDDSLSQKIFLERATHRAQTPIVTTFGSMLTSVFLLWDLWKGLHRSLQFDVQRGSEANAIIRVLAARGCPNGQHHCTRKLRSGRICGTAPRR